MALGYPPVLANVSNTVGLVPGNLSGAVAYRRELVGQRRRVLQLGHRRRWPAGWPARVLLLALPDSVFTAAVPALILLACVLIALQPMLDPQAGRTGRPRPTHGGAVLFVGVFLTGVYGGYFGAAQGVILIALLAIFIDDDLQRLNGTKNVLALMVNAVCRPASSSPPPTSNWSVVGLIAAGSIVGGQLGAPLRRRIPATVLRAVIVTVGVGVAIGLCVEWH